MQFAGDLKQEFTTSFLRLKWFSHTKCNFHPPIDEVLMRHTISFFTVSLAVMLYGCAASPTVSNAPTNSGEQGTDDYLYEVRVGDCSNRMGDASPAIRKEWADLMKVPTTSMPSVFCRRINNALESGRLNRGDYQAVVFSGYVNPQILKILQGR